MALTAVSATVTDSDGIIWRRGSWKLEFLPNPQIPNLGLYRVDGSSLLDPSVISQNGALDNSGHFSLSCYDSTSITPVGSSWKLTVCPLSSAACGFYNFQTAGPSIDISSALTFLLPPPRFFGVYPNYGYDDVEVVLSNKPGSTYYNVNTQTQRYYNDQTGLWANVGTGPAGIQGPPGIAGNPSTILGTAQDSNTLTTQGIYYLPEGFSANGPSPSHPWDSRAGVLEVYSYNGADPIGPYVMQRYMSGEDNPYVPGEYFIRWYWNSASAGEIWSPWYSYLPTTRINVTLSGAQDPNTLTASGVYTLPDGLSTNAPNPPVPPHEAAMDWRNSILEVFTVPSGSIIQRLTTPNDWGLSPGGDPPFYIRKYFTPSGSLIWSSWYVFYPSSAA